MSRPKKNDVFELIQMPSNQFHPLVYIGGKPKFGRNVFIGLFSEVNAKGAKVSIGDHCDIASFVSINVADSHRKTLGTSKKIDRKDIVLERNVFVGSHSFVGGGVYLGHHSAVAAGTIITKPCVVPPYSLVIGNPAIIKPRYFQKKK